MTMQVTTSITGAEVRIQDRGASHTPFSVASIRTDGYLGRADLSREEAADVLADLLALGVPLNDRAKRYLRNAGETL